METIFFAPKTIRQFYKKFHSKSKDYEFLVAFILAKFLSKKWNTECITGFKLKSRYSRDIPEKGKANLVQVANILRKQIDDNTPIDVVIVPSSIKHLKRHVGTGRGFQLKRFMGKPKENPTKSLIDYLNSMSRKYTKIKNTTLFIIPEAPIIDFVKVQKSMNTKSYPFDAIMFLAVSKGTLFIGEIWPNPGMDGYDPKKLFNS